MKHSKHSVARMSQRGITHAMAALVLAYGFTRGDKVILNTKDATARLIEARCEKDDLSAKLDNGTKDVSGVMYQLAEIETEIRNLTKLIDKHGCVLVMLDDVLITVYRLDH